MSANGAPDLPPAHPPGMVRISDLFHRVSRILPEDQEVLKVPPTMKAAEALALMRDRGFSQLPIVQGSSVLGMFSYRSFALGAVRIANGRDLPGDLTVDEYVEQPEYVRITDDFIAMIDSLDRQDVALIGDPDRLQGIVTAIDVLRYLYSVASAFVLVEEIELSLRALISAAVDDQGFKECIVVSLSKKYEPERMPQKLEEMTFDDYLQIVGDGRNWLRFVPVFGGTRERFRARLEPIRNLRNDVFHFRRDVGIKEHEELATCRDWLLLKVRAAEARHREVQHG